MAQDGSEAPRRTFERRSRQPRALPRARGTCSIPRHARTRPWGSFGEAPPKATKTTKWSTQVGHLRRGGPRAQNCRACGRDCQTATNLFVFSRAIGPRSRGNLCARKLVRAKTCARKNSCARKFVRAENVRGEICAREQLRARQLVRILMRITKTRKTPFGAHFNCARGPERALKFQVHRRIQVRHLGGPGAPSELKWGKPRK